MKFVKCEGTPYEIGFAHGAGARAETAVSLATYKQMFSEHNLNWEESRRCGLTFEKAIRALDADLIDEMRGVADGAGLDYEDILAMNSRSEILSVTTGASSDEGCTAIGVVSDRTDTNRMYHCQNWDWRASQEKALIILRIEQPGKPSILMLTEGGIVGKIGLNSAGIAVTLNALSAPGKATGVPVHILLRGILNSKTFLEALDRKSVV
jgi:isopenicillin-N N-acyltransferase-like protein